MSMRRSWHGRRQPTPLADEFARFINDNGIPVFHQKRDVNSKCDECWDEILGNHSSACESCLGSGFVLILSPNANLPRKKAYVQFGQPPGGAGDAGLFFKAGGQHTKYSAYIYFDLITGKDVERGDRLVIKQIGLRQEMVVLHNDPQMAGAVQLGFVAECNSVANINLKEISG
jgi:hypothetical protein